MRIFLPLVLLFIFISANAAMVDAMYVGGADYKLLHIANDRNSGYLYAENYKHQKILIYKSNHSYPTNSSFMSEQIDNTDILSIVFECAAETGNRSCNLFFNRRTNKLSAIYPYILDYDGKKDVVAFYVKDKNTVVISRAFKACKNPLNYLIRIEHDSDFGIKTKFLPSGDLQLDYTAQSGRNIIKIIHPDYKKLFNDCGSKN